MATRKLTADEIAEFREGFALFDRNGDGYISVEELGIVMRAMGNKITEAELREIVEKADVDGNEKLDFSEFLELMRSYRRDDDNEADLRMAFSVFDRNGDGYISAAEMRFVMNNLGESLSEAETEELLAEADINGDGNIDYYEFIAMITMKGEYRR